MRRDPLRTLVMRLTAVAVAILLGMAAIDSWQAFERFDPVFTPELSRKATTVGSTLETQIERALHYGIPLQRLPGLEDLFREEVGRHAEIAYVAVVEPDGGILAAVGAPLEGRGRDAVLPLPGHAETVIPLDTAAGVVAYLHLGVDSAYLAKASIDLMLDVLSVLVVSVLLTFEVLLLVVNIATARVADLRHAAALAQAGDFRAVVPKGGGRDIAAVARACRGMLDQVNERFAALSARIADRRAEDGGRDPRVRAAEEGLSALAARFAFREPGADGRKTEGGQAPANLVFLRLPVFLFCLSEELSRPFLPAYAQSFAATAPWLSPDLVVSAPITLFMLIWALSQPGGARWSERWGRQRTFFFGAMLGGVSLFLTAYAATLYELLVWRGLTALGYGVVLITAQGIVVDHTTRDNRASGMATYIGGLLAAGVCGPVTGGIIADQIGFRATFVIGAAVAVLSGIAIAILLGRAARPHRAASAATLTLRAAAGLARNVRFVVLMVLSAIPTKIAATGVLFCLIPLLMAADGATKAEVGRVQMMYFVAFILVSPMAASLSDRWQARRGFITMGGVGTLLSCLPLVYVQAWWGIPLAIGSFGLWQGLIGAPQLTLVSQIAQEANLSETSAIGWYRLLERLGGAAGPLLAMWLSSLYGYEKAMVGIGLICGVTAVLFWLSFRPTASGPMPHVQEA